MNEVNKLVKNSNNNAIDTLNIAIFNNSLISKRFKPTKQTLEHLREISLHLRPQTTLHYDLVSNLLALIRECTNSDFDQKIVRTAFYIVMEMTQNDTCLINSLMTAKLKNEIYSVVSDDIREQHISLRLCLAWKNIGRLSVSQPNHYQSIHDIIIQQFQRMKYPEKQIKLFIGNKKADRDFETSLQLWCSVLSSIRRITSHKLSQRQAIDHLLPLSCHLNLLGALNKSSNDSMMKIHSIHVVLNCCRHINQFSNQSSADYIDSYIQSLIHILSSHMDNILKANSNLSASNNSYFDHVFWSLFFKVISEVSGIRTLTSGDKLSYLVPDSTIIELYQKLFRIPMIRHYVFLDMKIVSNIADNRIHSAEAANVVSITSNKVDSLTNKASFTIDEMKLFTSLFQEVLSDCRSLLIIESFKNEEGNVFILPLVQHLMLRLTYVFTIFNHYVRNLNLNLSSNTSVKMNGDVDLLYLVLPGLLRCVISLGKFLLRYSNCCFIITFVTNTAFKFDTLEISRVLNC